MSNGTMVISVLDVKLVGSSILLSSTTAEITIDSSETVASAIVKFTAATPCASVLACSALKAFVLE